MNPAIRNIIVATLGVEGLYSNDPADRGGETFRGISRKHWPQWPGWPVVDQSKNIQGFPGCLSGNPILMEQVYEFYHAQFIDAIGLEQLKNMNIVAEVFDSAVNCGRERACRWVQEGYNLCNQNGEIGPDLVVDGNIGPKTAAAVNAFPATRLNVYLKVLNLLQGERYLNICRIDHSQQRFLHGWVENRIQL